MQKHSPVKFEYCKYIFWKCRDTQTSDLSFLCMTAHCLSDHRCINVFRMSCVRVRFSGTMALLTHARTLSLFVSLFLSLSNTHTHAQNTHTQHAFKLLTFFYLFFFCKHGSLPSHCLTTLLYSWQSLNIQILQALFKTIRNLNMHLWAGAWGKGSTATKTRAFRWSKFRLFELFPDLLWILLESYWIFDTGLIITTCCYWLQHVIFAAQTFSDFFDTFKIYFQGTFLP